MGIFTGIAPIWGFQLVTAIGLSILLRLNKALVIVAANISIPPMIPFIIYASHWMGRWWMGEKAQSISFTKEITLGFIHENAVQYFTGAFTLAILSAIGFGLMTLMTLKLIRFGKSVRHGNRSH